MDVSWSVWFCFLSVLLSDAWMVLCFLHDSACFIVLCCTGKFCSTCCLVYWFQPAFVVHVFPPCEFSMQVVNDHSQGLVEQIHDLAHVIIIITTVWTTSSHHCHRSLENSLRLSLVTHYMSCHPIPEIVVASIVDTPVILELLITAIRMWMSTPSMLHSTVIACGVSLHPWWDQASPTASVFDHDCCLFIYLVLCVCSDGSARSQSPWKITISSCFAVK